MNPLKFAATKTKQFFMSVFSLSDANAAYYLTGGRITASGKIVTPESSLQTIAVLACVRLLSEAGAGLPLHVFRAVSDDVAERQPNHWLQGLLDRPNSEMSGVDFRVAMNAGLETWGNAYARKVLSGNETIGLWPLPHGKVERRQNDNGIPYYRYHAEGGDVDYPAGEIFHLRGFSLDGITGLSPVAQARQGIGLNQATEEYGARYFGRDAKPPVVLEIPNKLNAEQRAQILKSWNEARQGEDACGIGISEGGMKVHVLNIPPEDSQFLETRGFNDAQIARLFGVPPHMIGLTDKTTSWGAGIEQMSIGFVVYSLTPRLRYWEDAITRSLLTDRDRKQRIFARHNVKGLLRGDHKSRSDAYATMRQNGVVNANEWRAVEDLPPIAGDDGTRYLVNGTMIPISQAGQKTQTEVNNNGQGQN
jgi:HK97 family phage portal protein